MSNADRSQYAEPETSLSEGELQDVLSAAEPPVCLLGGWAVHLQVTGGFQDAHDRAYIGSRDIDLGIHLNPSWSTAELRTAPVETTLERIENDLGYSRGRFGFYQQFHRDTHERLDDVPVTLAHDDPYKPYGSESGIGHRTEVDHIEAASLFGGDDLDNLQATCQLCNRAKNKDLTIPAETEFEYAASAIDDVPPYYRARMVYHVIKQRDHECARCGERESELTIRPIHGEGPYVRSNMEPVCVSCLGWREAPSP